MLVPDAHYIVTIVPILRVETNSNLFQAETVKRQPIFKLVDLKKILHPWN